MATLLLIDAYSQIYRSFYAIRNLTDPAGRPVNALFGMARLFQQLDEQFPSEYGAIVYDLGKCTRRCALLPEYKAQRPPMPPELRLQLADIREWAAAFGWNLVEREGFEADDLICGLVAARGEAQALILSSDKDLSQLVSGEAVRMLVKSKEKDGRLVPAGEEYVREKFGVAPAQVRDYLALLGDSVDNIPGVPGCGAKTAAKLLLEYGDIDQLLARADAISAAKLREAILANRQRILDNRSLVQLDQALPEDWRELAQLRRRPPDWSRLAELARRHNFRSFLEHFAAKAPAPAADGAAQLTFGF